MVMRLDRAVKKIHHAYTHCDGCKAFLDKLQKRPIPPTDTKEILRLVTKDHDGRHKEVR